MILEDFVMLGTTVPEPNRAGDRVMVCSAGYSSSMGGLLRIYPLAVPHPPKRWNQYRVELERPERKDDVRPESWKISGDRSPDVHWTINQRFEALGRLAEGERAAALGGCFLPSIKWADARCLSLGLLRPERPEAMRLHFEVNRDSPDWPRLPLFDVPLAQPRFGSKIFPFRPYLQFADREGWHDLQVRDWGCYELMRKHRDDPEYYQRGMRDALHLGPLSCLLVGNLNHRRNVWVVIAVLNGLIDARQLTLVPVEA